MVSAAMADECPWLRRSFEVTLVADQYNYAMADIASDLWRIDSKSLRYGDRSTFLTWGDLDAIDSELEPSWKDAATASGTPQYATRQGLELWIAGKPSEAFVADHPTLYGYGWRMENISEDSGANSGYLWLPQPLMGAAVTGALAYGWDEEDDPRADKMLGRFQNVWVPRLRAFEFDSNVNNTMIAPSFAYDNEIGDDYGDMRY